jgi:hypothetical protein
MFDQNVAQFGSDLTRNIGKRAVDLSPRLASHAYMALLYCTYELNNNNHLQYTDVRR